MVLFSIHQWEAALVLPMDPVCPVGMLFVILHPPCQPDKSSGIPSPNRSARPLKERKKPVVNRAIEEKFHTTITGPCDSIFSSFALGLCEEFTPSKPLERWELANKSVCTRGKHPGVFIAELELITWISCVKYLPFRDVAETIHWRFFCEQQWLSQEWFAIFGSIFSIPRLKSYLCTSLTWLGHIVFP